MSRDSRSSSIHQHSSPYPNGISMEKSGTSGGALSRVRVVEDDDDDESPPPVVDRDPTGRFERYAQQLGKGAYKTVYRAFDQEDGVEVAWNQLRVDYLSDADADKIRDEVAILEKLRHPNIIKLYHSWSATNANGQEMVYFITELMTSGTLKKYLRKTTGKIRPKFLKTVSVQILRALDYLHTRDPPILHRDLKCDNIFVNGNNGEVKIGDLGLATVRNLRHVTSVIGTPEFMAPELYDEEYDEKVDVYAFGMCLLEMISKEYPYSECANQAQIYKRVTQGIKPEALKKVDDPQMRLIVEACLESNPDKRPSARQLLDFPFWKISETPVLGPEKYSTSPEKELGLGAFSLSATTSATPSNAKRSNSGDSQSGFGPAPPMTRHSTNESVSTSKLPGSVAAHPRPPGTGVGTTIVHGNVELVRREDDATLILKLTCRVAGSSRNQAVKFPFVLGADTPQDVVAEMVKEEVLQEADRMLVEKNVQRIMDRIAAGESIDAMIAASAPKGNPFGVTSMPSTPGTSMGASTSPQKQSRSISGGNQTYHSMMYQMQGSGRYHMSIHMERAASAAEMLPSRDGTRQSSLTEVDRSLSDPMMHSSSLPGRMLASEVAALASGRQSPANMPTHRRTESGSGKGSTAASHPPKGEQAVPDRLTLHHIASDIHPRDLNISPKSISSSDYFPVVDARMSLNNSPLDPTNALPIPKHRRSSVTVMASRSVGSDTSSTSNDKRPLSSDAAIASVPPSLRSPGLPKPNGILPTGGDLSDDATVSSMGTATSFTAAIGDIDESELMSVLEDDPQLMSLWVKQQREAQEMQRNHRAEWNILLQRARDKRLHKEEDG